MDGIFSMPATAITPQPARVVRRADVTRDDTIGGMIAVSWASYSPAVGVERHDAPLFPRGEYRGRVARVRERMAADGIDACLVLGPDSQFWLCGLESFISGVLSQALLVPAGERESMSLVMWEADVPLARDSCVVDDIRGYRFGVDDPVDVFAAVIAERVPEARTIGLDSSSRAVPHALGSRLSAKYNAAEWVDATALLGEARLVKSPLELSHVRLAGQYADAGLAAARKCARPGMSERDLAAEIEYAMRRAGSDLPIDPDRAHVRAALGVRSRHARASPARARRPDPYRDWRRRSPLQRRRAPDALRRRCATLRGRRSPL